jgi:hypothetical protein
MTSDVISEDADSWHSVGVFSEELLEVEATPNLKNSTI